MSDQPNAAPQPGVQFEAVAGTAGHVGAKSVEAAGVVNGAGDLPNYDHLFDPNLPDVAPSEYVPSTGVSTDRHGSYTVGGTYIAPPASNEQVAATFGNGINLAAQDKYAPYTADAVRKAV